MRDSRVCRAFTLIELLVVVGVIGVLMSLLLPSLRSARDTAKSSVCAARQKEVFHAAQGYAGDFDGWLPSPQSDVLTGIQGWQANLDPAYYFANWTQSVYAGPFSSLFLCPADADPYHQLNDKVRVKGGRKQISYGLNLAMFAANGYPVTATAFLGYPLRPSDIRRPAETVFAADGGVSSYRNSNVFRFWSNTTLNLVLYQDPDTQVVPGTFSWNEILLRHNGGRGYNAVFADGHVENAVYPTSHRSFTPSYNQP